MPRGLKTDKFYIYAAKKSGQRKDKMLLGVNGNDEDNVTLQDLLDFLGEKNISPAKVVIHFGFTTYINVS
jgi:hypothetical protein